MPGRFIIEPQDHYFKFTFISSNENIVLFSRLFRSEKSCKEGIAEVQKFCLNINYVDKMTDTSGQFSFAIRNAKGIIIVFSAIFYACSTRDMGIRLVAHEAPYATIVEMESALRQ